jgi:hypothetical protein
VSVGEGARQENRNAEVPRGPLCRVALPVGSVCALLIALALAPSAAAAKPKGEPAPSPFQLHGNGYRFAAGDTVKPQLLGRDARYYRASNGAFAVQASNVTVTLPTG